MLTAIVVLLSFIALFLFISTIALANISTFISAIQAGTKFGQQAKNQFGNN